MPYGRGKELIEKLRDAYSPKALLRELQPYTISLPKKAFESGAVKVAPETGISILIDGYYSEEYGFTDESEMEAMII